MQLTECSYSDYNKLASAITEFNLAHLPPKTSSHMQALGFVLRANPWSLIGGVTGRMVLGNCLSIEILWIEPEHRNKDYATQLLSTIENAARKLGSKLSIVDTFEFQALDFYKKQGYKVFGELKDCPTEGHIRYYLSKSL